MVGIMVDNRGISYLRNERDKLAWNAKTDICRSEQKVTFVKSYSLLDLGIES